MTDEELLELVESKSPGDLSLDEIQILRGRLAESAELRTAFSSRLRLQTFLAEVLARIDLAPDDVLRSSSQPRSARSAAGLWKYAAVLCLLAAIGAAIGVPQLRERLRTFVHQLSADTPRQVVDKTSRHDESGNPDVDVAAKKGEDPDPQVPGANPQAAPASVASDEEPKPAAEPGAEQDAKDRTLDGPDAARKGAARESSNATDPDADAGAGAGAGAGADTDPKRDPPWQAALDSDPIFPLQTVLFQRFDTRKVLPQTVDLHDWFDVIVGEPKGIVEARSKHGQCGAIEGILRLKAPWTDDSILRLELETYKQLQIHFFSGEQGLTLVYHADKPERWAAYLTTRKPGRYTPLTWRLTADDGGRNRRTMVAQGASYQLRHRDGELLLSRGDIDVIRAPLGNLPEDVYFQGRAAIVGIDWQRTRTPQATPDAPDAGAQEIGAVEIDANEIQPSVESSQEVLSATEFAWQSHLEPNATLVPLPNGAIRLESKGATKRSWSTIWRPRDQLYTIDLELEDALAGAGLYLGDVANPKWVLRYVHDNRTDQLCLLPRGNDDHRAQNFRPLHEAMLPSVGGRHWVRLLCGPSMIRWWLSADGTHWAEGDPLRKPPIKLTHLGLHCVSGAKCGVTLRQVRLTPLTEISGLSDPELRQRGMLLDALNEPSPPSDVATWLAQITELQPLGSSLEAWRRTAAVQTLSSGCTAPLGNALLDLLLDDAQARGLPMETQLRLLDQASLLADLYDGQQQLQAWVDRYHTLGLDQAEANQGKAFSSIRAALMNSSLITARNFDVFHPQAIGQELLHLVYSGDWSATARFCRRIRFFQLQAKVPLFEWAEAAAAKRTPEGLSDEILTRLPETWRNVLVEHQSKDVYNFSAELSALIESEAFDDAARMIATLDPRELQGVAVDARDDRLLAALPAIITMADRRHPKLRAAVIAEQSALAELRLNEQISLHDAEGVAMVALQFPGTAAVSKAHAWLGDRALSSGWFELASWHYQRASESSPPLVGMDLGSRQTLVQIMMGRETQAGAHLPRLGDMQIKIEEVATIQASLQAEPDRGLIRYTANGFAGPHTQTTAPTEFIVHKKSKLDGSVGQEPKRVLNGNINVFNVDWVNRQLAVAVDRQHLLVSNRFQVAAYDSNTGARTWTSSQLPGRVRRAHDWSLTAMRPVLRQERIYARQLYGDTTSLVCLERSTGKPIWIAAHRRDIDIISDPMFVQDRLICLTMARRSQLESVVRFTTFDPETGTVWRESDLVTLSNAWMRRQVCEVQTLPDGIVTILGGIVVRCDIEGRVRWVSRQILLPPDEQPDWVTQTFSPPLIFSDAELGGSSAIDNRIYVSEPGVRELFCLDDVTGQLVWTRTLPDLKRLMGIVNGNLIAHGIERLLGLDPATGETRWERPIEPLLHGYLCGGEHGILVARRQPTDETNSKFVPELVWVDGRTGRDTHSTRLTGLDDPDPRLGPMVVKSGQIWTLLVRGPNDAFPELLQLVPAGTPTAANVATAIGDPWQRVFDVDLQRALQQRLADWTLLGGMQTTGTGIVPELHGEKEVLSLATHQGDPLILGRMLDLPLNTRPRLRLTLGSEVKHPGLIEVRFQGLTVGQFDITPKTHTTPWKTFDVDLQDFAGESGWLTIHARFTDGENPVLVAWKQLEVVF